MSLSIIDRFYRILVAKFDPSLQKLAVIVDEHGSEPIRFSITGILKPQPKSMLAAFKIQIGKQINTRRIRFFRWCVFGWDQGRQA